MATTPIVKKPKDPFVAVRRSGVVMRGQEYICKAVSHTMAKRIARALNDYQPNERGY